MLKQTYFKTRVYFIVCFRMATKDLKDFRDVEPPCKIDTFQYIIQYVPPIREYGTWEAVISEKGNFDYFYVAGAGNWPFKHEVQRDWGMESLIVHDIVNGIKLPNSYTLATAIPMLKCTINCFELFAVDYNQCDFLFISVAKGDNVTVEECKQEAVNLLTCIYGQDKYRQIKRYLRQYIKTKAEKNDDMQQMIAMVEKLICVNDDNEQAVEILKATKANMERELYEGETKNKRSKMC